MCRNEALEAAIEECRKAGVEFRIERKKNHHQLLINGSNKVLTISNTRAITTVRTDVRRVIRGNENGLHHGSR